MRIIKPERIHIFAAIINKSMSRVEFKTIVHNRTIELPMDSAEIKDQEVKVIILWDEKPVKKNNLADLKARIKTKMTGEEIVRQIQSMRNEWDRGI
jgi:hypothetical protein